MPRRGGRPEQADRDLHRLRRSGRARAAIQPAFQPHGPVAQPEKHPGDLADQLFQGRLDALSPGDGMFRRPPGLQLRRPAAGRYRLVEPADRLIPTLKQLRPETRRKLIPGQRLQLADPIDAQVAQQPDGFLRDPQGGHRQRAERGEDFADRNDYKGGRRKAEGGKWRVESGEWRVADGKTSWKIVDTRKT